MGLEKWLDFALEDEWIFFWSQGVFFQCTFLGTSIFVSQGMFEDYFPFPRWDMFPGGYLKVQVLIA